MPARAAGEPLRYMRLAPEKRGDEAATEEPRSAKDVTRGPMGSAARHPLGSRRGGGTRVLPAMFRRVGFSRRDERSPGSIVGPMAGSCSCSTDGEQKEPIMRVEACMSSDARVVRRCGGRRADRARAGRYMRALKSVLGGPLLRETRMIGGTRQTLADVIAAFLRALRERAEAVTGRGTDGRSPAGRYIFIPPIRRATPGRRRNPGTLSRRGVRGGRVPRRARGRGARVSGAGISAPPDWSSTSAAEPRTSPPSSSRTARCGCSQATASGSAVRTSTRRSQWPMRCRSSASAASCAARFGPGLLPVPKAIYADLGDGAPLGLDSSSGLRLTGAGLSEEEGPCPDTAATASTSSVRSLPSITPGRRFTRSADAMTCLAT